MKPSPAVKLGSATGIQWKREKRIILGTFGLRYRYRETKYEGYTHLRSLCVPPVGDAVSRG